MRSLNLRALAQNLSHHCPTCEISTKQDDSTNIAGSQVLICLSMEHAGSYVVCELFGFLAFFSYVDQELWSLRYSIVHQV